MTWKIKGKLVLITGGTDGIGKQTVFNLANSGAKIVLVGRNKEKTENVVNETIEKTGNQDIDYLLADLTKQSEIRNLAQEFGEKYKKLDVLFNNAGGSFTKRVITEDGVEKTFALNQLSYFLLTHLMLPLLKKSKESRIVCTASGAHRNGKIIFDDINNNGLIPVWAAYSRSKLANIMFVYALARRLEGSSVTVNCLHPGFVSTNIGRGNGKVADFLFGKLFDRGIPVEAGAETPTYLIKSDLVSGVSGKYFYKKEAIVSVAGSNVIDSQEKLWELCKDLTGIEKY